MGRRNVGSVVWAVALFAMVVGACSSSRTGVSRSSSSSSTRAPVTSTSTTGSTTTTEPTDPALVAVRGHTIVVDAGHAGGNATHAAEISRPVFIGTQNRACDATGTATNDGYPEHEFTLDVALRLEAILTQAGAKVVMVRREDTSWGPCIDERARIGNRAGAEAGISIHADGASSSAHGFHVNVPANIPGYTDDIYAASATLGKDLRDSYASVTGTPYANYIGTAGLVERRDFGGLNFSDVPKVLFETGNMRNAEDARQLENPEFRQRIAYAFATGFAAYFER